ncbi:hypothetical protein [Paraglaciecola sp. L1A13]|uniref:hypothetical protein n=1 Tax=Paraglaciecola sp. L1A13 TaxID=2686359 RepID=UPI00131BEB5D|nr:hypothetical protein [Paraglaciecola sp. L1A13]
MLVCAEDGWVDFWSDGIPSDWNYMGCTKYQSILIYCLLPDGQLQKVKPVSPNLNWFEKTLWKVTNSSKEVTFEIAVIGQSSIEKFKAILLQAVKTDDDLLTQFKSEDEITLGIEKSKSYSDLNTLFTECGWV